MELSWLHDKNQILLHSSDDNFYITLEILHFKKSFITSGITNSKGSNCGVCSTINLDKVYSLHNLLENVHLYVGRQLAPLHNS